MSSKGVKKKNITSVSDIEHLQQRCEQLKLASSFINEDCFIHETDSSERIRSVINQHPETLFFFFMAISNIHFEEYLYVRKNLITYIQSN